MYTGKKTSTKVDTWKIHEYFLREKTLYEIAQERSTKKTQQQQHSNNLIVNNN